MLNNADYTLVRDLLLSNVQPVGTERVLLSAAVGRILAQPLKAETDVPPFDRSAYDGYAFRASDTAQAARSNPVTLFLLEEVPAGVVPTKTVTPGTAVKILTGAPIPEGADAVAPFEQTRFTVGTVTVFQPFRSGENIVRRGEDVSAGTLLAYAGTRIDAGLAGTLASQGICAPLVYKRPKVGLISTGRELLRLGDKRSAGKIYNSNLYTLSAALQKLGCEAVDLGIADDRVESIAALFRKGLTFCDAVISTGGVSVGDYDLTGAAMEAAGAEMLATGLHIKPGMASAFARKGTSLLMGLSGNPASSITAFYAVAQPVLRKLAGQREYLPEEITVTLCADFSKPSRNTRLLRGTLVLKDGTVGMLPAREQGNAVISSAIGNNVLAIIPAGSGPVPAGTKLKGFLL